MIRYSRKGYSSILTSRCDMGSSQLKCSTAAVRGRRYGKQAEMKGLLIGHAICQLFAQTFTTAKNF